MYVSVHIDEVYSSEDGVFEVEIDGEVYDLPKEELKDPDDLMVGDFHVDVEISADWVDANCILEDEIPEED